MTSAVPSSNPRSPRFRRGGLTAVLAGALLAGSTALAVTAAPASASYDDDDDGPSPTYTSLITLQTGEKNAFTLYPPTTAELRSIQPLASTSSKNCTIKTPAGSVVALTGSSAPGLRSGSIGVADQTSGQACSQVNAGTPPEALTIDLLTLHSDLAVLDVELQKNAVILATAYNGDTVAGYFELQSGTNIKQDGKPISPQVATVATCQVASSSGPNSNVSDNCRWVIEGAVFNRIVLTAVAGQFSLEGGADGTVTRRTAPEPAGYPAKLSYFRTVVPCTPENATATVSGSTQAGDGSSFTRENTNADGSTCVALPTTLRRDTVGDLELVKAPGQPFQQGVLTAEWLANPGTDSAVNKTEVNFWADKRESGWVTIPWCPTALLAPGGTVEWLTGIVPATAVAQLNALGLADQDQRTLELGNDNGLYQYACVLSRSTTYTEPTPETAQYETVEKIYMLGDIFIRR